MENFKLSTEVFERYMDASVELFMECYAETITIDSDAELQEQGSPQLNKKMQSADQSHPPPQKAVGLC